MSTFWKTQIKALEYRTFAYSFNSHKLLRSHSQCLHHYAQIHTFSKIKVMVHVL